MESINCHHHLPPRPAPRVVNQCPFMLTDDINNVSVLFACMTGRVGARGHTDNIVNSPQCHHAERPDQFVVQRPQILVSAHQERTGIRPWLVHVSN